MENINCLTSLKKLYLGYNEISVVEGLEGMKNLSELHLENQRLPQGETLFFDPRTISHLNQSLKILNLANNNIDSVSPLENLTALTKLIIDGNKLKNVKDFTETIYCWPFLEELNCDDNPMVNDRKYFDEIVVASKSLKILNGKQINERLKTNDENLGKSRFFFIEIFLHRTCHQTKMTNYYFFFLKSHPNENIRCKNELYLKLTF